MTRYAFVFDETGAQITDGQPVAEITLPGEADPAFTVEPGIDFFGPDGTGYPANYIADSASGNRTARGLFPVTEDPPPDGQRVASEVILVASARPVATSTFEDIPDPGVPTSITNYQAYRQLAENGGYDATLAAVNSSGNAELKAYIAQKKVYFRSDDMITALLGIFHDADPSYDDSDMDEFFTLAKAWPEA